MFTKAAARRLAIAGSLATCCFLNTWVLLAQGTGLYFVQHHPFASIAVPILAWQVAIAAVVLGGWRLLRGSRFADLALLAACAAPAVFAGRAFIQLLPIDIYAFRVSLFFWPLFLGLGGLLAGFVLLRPAGASRVTKEGLLYAWPILGVLYASAAWQMWVKAKPADFEDSRAVASVEVRAEPGARRVLWFIFDGLSRGPAEQSPAFSSLAAQAFSATSAKAAAGATELAMPALIHGYPVSGANPVGPRKLVLTGNQLFGDGDHVFRAVRKLGRETALAGWYHPYCRVLGDTLNECVWQPGWVHPGLEELPRDTHPMLSRLLFQVRAMPMMSKLGVGGEAVKKQVKRETSEWLVEHASRMVANPDYGLVLIHVNEPHPPNVFRRSPERVESSYLDSVAHASLILEGLLAKVREAGLSERTALVVSADHGFRPGNWRTQAGWTSEDEALSRQPGLTEIPFLVSLPNGGKPMRYEKPFEALRTRRLIEGILSGRINTYSDVAEFLSHNGGGA